MPNALDGLSNMYALTAQINALKKQGISNNGAISKDTIDPQSVLLSFQQYLNQTLNNLLISSDQNNENSNDSLFSSLLSSTQQSINDLSNQAQQSQPSNKSGNISVSPYSGAVSYSEASKAQLNALIAQNSLNLNNF